MNSHVSSSLFDATESLGDETPRVAWLPETVGLGLSKRFVFAKVGRRSLPEFEPDCETHFVRVSRDSNQYVFATHEVVRRKIRWDWDLNRRKTIVSLRSTLRLPGVQIPAAPFHATESLGDETPRIAWLPEAVGLGFEPRRGKAPPALKAGALGHFAIPPADGTRLFYPGPLRPVGTTRHSPVVLDPEAELLDTRFRPRWNDSVCCGPRPDE